MPCLIFPCPLRFRPVCRHTFRLLFRQTFPPNRQHEFDPVLLIYPRRAWIIVNGRNIRLRVLFPDFVDHALAADVIGQTAERLRADNISIARSDQFHHLRREKPALSHFVPRADQPVSQMDQLRERKRGVEAAAFQRADDQFLNPGDIG